MTRSFFYFLIVCFSFSTTLVCGQRNHLPLKLQVKDAHYLRFSSFNIEGIESIGIVSKIVQDRTGFVWLAGEKGLGRYDGFRLKNYGKNHFYQQHIGLTINDFILDKNGTLWIATDGGVFTYNSKTDTFVTIIGEADLVSAPNDSLHIRALSLISDTMLWIERFDGVLASYNLRKGVLQPEFKHQHVSQPYYRYHSILADGDSVLYFGGRSIGPYRFSLSTKKAKLLPIQSDGKSGVKREEDLSINKKFDNDHIWIGGLDGLYLYTKPTNFFTKIADGTVYDLLLDSKGNYWLGTGKGIVKFSAEGGSALRYSKNNDDHESIGGMRIYSIFEDRSGQLWFSHENGISLLQPETEGVNYIFHIPGNQQTPASSTITAMALTGSDSLWIATDDEGLDLFQLLSGSITHFHPSSRKDILATQIRTLRNDTSGNLYIGYWAGKGFGRFLTKQKKFENFRYDNKKLAQDWYSDFAFIDSEKVLCGFWGGPGLTEFDAKKGRFGTVIASQLADAYNSRLITKLLHDTKKRTWVGTTQTGIHLRNSPEDLFIPLSFNDSLNEFIHPKKVLDIKESKDGTVWIAGNEGLYEYDESKQRVVKIKWKGSYHNLEIYGILPDLNQAIWLFTSQGLMKYTKDETRLADFSMEIRIRFKPNQATGLFFGNKLILGGSNGLAVITPELLGKNQRFPKLFLTHADVNNQTLFHGLSEQTSITFPYNKNFFSIHYGADQMKTTVNYAIYYLLEGFEKDWVRVNPGQHQAYFPNVPPGNYKFRMRIADHYGNSGSETALLDIVVLKPWWKSWWFILLVATISIVAFTLIWQIRLKELRLKLSNIELNQKLLRLQMNPHFIFNSLTSIQHFIYSNKQHQAGQHLSDFASLVRLILENSRHETISLQKEIETIQLYMEIQQLRFTHGFTFIIEKDEQLDVELTRIPPMLAQPFLENALEHGLQKKDKDGRIIVRYIKHPNTIRFEVEDNGIGLQAALEQKEQAVFQHESLSVKICRERLELLEKQYRIKIHFEMKELQDMGLSKGTKIIFDIPLLIHDFGNE